MATSKPKKHYYVLVMTDEGPKFVTKVNHSDRTAEWNMLEKPYEFSEMWAHDLAMGLNLNGHLAYTVCQKWEIDNQPYRYKSGKLEWVSNEKKGEDEADDRK